MGAIFFLSNSKFCLAIPGGPYMTPLCLKILIGYARNTWIQQIKKQ
jgi:hypothetical protein